MVIIMRLIFYNIIMFRFKLINNLSKKNITLIAFIIIVLIFILGRAYIIEVVNAPAFRIHVTNISKVVIPLKNRILMRNLDDKISILSSSGSCAFCDISKGNFKGMDLKGVNLSYANLSYANLDEVNLSGADLSNADLTGASFNLSNFSDASLNGVNLIKADLTNADLTGADLRNSILSGALLMGVNLSFKDFNGTILKNANLSGARLDGVNLSNKDLTGVNMNGINLSNTDLNGANLTGVPLKKTILSGANLIEVDLSDKNMNGANLTGLDLSDKDFSGSSLTGSNLTGVNLNGINLINMDMSGSILKNANLSGANLSNTNLNGADLSNANLNGAYLSGVDLSNTNLTGAIFKDVKKIKLSLKNPTNSNWPAISEIQKLNVTRYDLNGDIQFLTTKSGFLYRSKNNESELVLDLNKNSLLPFTNKCEECGLFGVVTNNNFVYISYSSKHINGLFSLVVDEYSMDFTKVRNIIKIDGFENHFAGNLSFDSLGKLYLAVGDGNIVEGDIQKGDVAQNLNSLRGKILRLDISQLKQDPEIIAYGLRDPWGVSIDSIDRMFILQCGWRSVEGVYLLTDLYPDIPANLGWPVFEGSKRNREGILTSNDVLAPVYETYTRPVCLTGGVYLDDIEAFLFADFYGTIGLLKQKVNGEWYLLHEYKQDKSIWGLGLNKKNNKIFVAPNNLEIEILINQINLNH